MDMNTPLNTKKEDKSPIKRVHVFISGAVQGIFFRSFIQRKALMLDINGWVRNTEDDKVECVFEANQGRIQSMLEYCRKGPDGAKVENISVKEEEVKGEKGFRIVY